MEKGKGIDKFYCDGISNGLERCVEQCAYCVKEELNSDGVGLGDVVARITDVTGIKKVVEMVLPNGCDCGRRHRELNKIRIKNLKLRI